MAKTEEKYDWQVGCRPPVLQQHSAVKHKILESYVREYILTIMAPAHIPMLKLTLVDGFSGGGSYLSENNDIVDGSPLLMLKAVQDARTLLNLGREKPRTIDVNYEFIDIKPSTIDHLDYWIDCRYQQGLISKFDKARIHTTCGNFLDESSRLISTIKSQRMGERVIFVLDQYNYRDIPLKQIAQILNSLQGAEVIFTFNVGSLITYLADHAASRRPMEEVGLDKHIPWNQIKHIKAEEKRRWKKILQRYLAHGIRVECGARFMTPFFVRPHGTNTWDYWLIHLSHRYRAHDVMKRLHWQFGNMFSHELEHGIFLQGYDANVDEDYTGQSDFFFDEIANNSCIDRMREDFGRLIYDGADGIKAGQLFEACAPLSTGSEEQFQTATYQLHAQKDIVVLSADGTVRRPSHTYRKDDLILRSPQIRIPMF